MSKKEWHSGGSAEKVLSCLRALGTYFAHVAGFQVFWGNDTWDGLSMIQGVGKMGTQPSVLLRKCSVAYAIGP